MTGFHCGFILVRGGKHSAGPLWMGWGGSQKPDHDMNTSCEGTSRCTGSNPTKTRLRWGIASRSELVCSEPDGHHGEPDRRRPSSLNPCGTGQECSGSYIRPNPSKSDHRNSATKSRIYGLCCSGSMTYFKKARQASHTQSNIVKVHFGAFVSFVPFCKTLFRSGNYTWPNHANSV